MILFILVILDCLCLFNFMKDDILSSVIFEIYKNFAMFEISVEDGMSELVFFILFKMETFSVAFLLQ